MKWHPLCLKFELMTGADWERFKEGIRATKGVKTQRALYRMVKGERQGLDGRQRYLACKELGLPCRLMRVRVPDKDVAGFILAHQFNRRHISAESRQSIIEQLRAEGQSYRQIAETLNTGKSTVHRAGSGTTVPGGTVTGRDGRTQPASRPSVASYYPVSRLVRSVDDVLGEIDECAKSYGLEPHDDDAGQLRGLAMQLRIRLERWGESLS